MGATGFRLVRMDQRLEKEKSRRCRMSSQPTVYYASDDPSQSVLQRKGDINGVIIFLILELICAGLIYFDYQQW